MWKNNLQESVPSSYHIGPIDKTLVLKLGSKRFYSVSHLSGSLCALLDFYSNEYDMLFKARQNNIDSDYNMRPAPPISKMLFKDLLCSKNKIFKKSYHVLEIRRNVEVVIKTTLEINIKPV